MWLATPWWPWTLKDNGPSSSDTQDAGSDGSTSSEPETSAETGPSAKRRFSIYSHPRRGLTQDGGAEPETGGDAASRAVDKEASGATAGSGTITTAGNSQATLPKCRSSRLSFFVTSRITQVWGRNVSDPQSRGTGRPQTVDGTGYHAEHWGVTIAQVRAFLAECQQLPEWRPENTMYDLVEQYVVPKTRGTGLGLALLMNRDEPKRVGVMVSHAWAENAEEFVDCLERSASPGDVLFVCALGIYQGEDGAGPSIEDQLGALCVESPFMRVLQSIREQGEAAGWVWRWKRVLEVTATVAVVVAAVLACAEVLVCNVGGHARTTEEMIGLAFLATLGYACRLAIARRGGFDGRMLVVPNRESDLYSRLWCVFEVYAAAELRVPVVLARTLARAGSCKASSAKCGNFSDENSIRAQIEATMGYEAVDRQIGRVMRSVRISAAASAIAGGAPVAIMFTTLMTIYDHSKSSGLLTCLAKLAGVSLGLSLSLAGAYLTARRGVATQGCVAAGDAARLTLGLSAFGCVLMWSAWLLDTRAWRLDKRVPEEEIHGLGVYVDDTFSVTEVVIGFGATTLSMGCLMCVLMGSVYLFRALCKSEAALRLSERGEKCFGRCSVPWHGLICLALVSLGTLFAVVHFSEVGGAAAQPLVATQHPLERDPHGCWMHCMIVVVLGILIAGPLALVSRFASSWGVTLGPLPGAAAPKRDFIAI